MIWELSMTLRYRKRFHKGDKNRTELTISLVFISFVPLAVDPRSHSNHIYFGVKKNFLLDLKL